MTRKVPIYPSNEAEKSRDYGVPIEDVTCWNCGHEGVVRIYKHATIAGGSLEAVCDCVYCPIIAIDGCGDFGIEGDPHICDVCEAWVPRSYDRFHAEVRPDVD